MDRRTGPGSRQQSGRLNRSAPEAAHRTIHRSLSVDPALFALAQHVLVVHRDAGPEPFDSHSDQSQSDPLESERVIEAGSGPIDLLG